MAAFLDSVILNQGQFCSAGDICQSLETFFIVTTRRLILLGRDRDADKLATPPTTAPYNKNYLMKNVSSGEVENPELAR